MASEMPASKIMGGLIEARSVVTGTISAPCVHFNGHAYVPAATHQRTLEALREAEKAFRLIVDGREVRDPLAPETTRVESLPGDEIEAICEAALARIKEATDAQR